MFGFESITLRATSLCTTQESLLPWQPLAWIGGTLHAGQVQTWIYGSATTRVTSAFQAGRQRQGVKGSSAAIRGAQAARTEGHTQGLWAEQHSGEGRRMKGAAKVSGSLRFFFNAFPASPACFMFKKLQFPSLPQPSCTKQEMLTAGGSRLHSITQTKSNPGIFVLLPSHTWLAPTLMLLRGTQCTEWFTNYGTNSADLPLKNFLWSQWD